MALPAKLVCTVQYHFNSLKKCAVYEFEKHEYSDYKKFVIIVTKRAIQDR